MFTVITTGFDPPTEMEINNVYYILSMYLSIYLYIHIQIARSLRLLATCSPIAIISAYALMAGAISPLILQFRLVLKY